MKVWFVLQFLSVLGISGTAVAGVILENHGLPQHEFDTEPESPIDNSAPSQAAGGITRDIRYIGDFVDVSVVHPDHPPCLEMAGHERGSSKRITSCLVGKGRFSHLAWKKTVSRNWMDLIPEVASPLGELAPELGRRNAVERFMGIELMCFSDNTQDLYRIHPVANSTGHGGVTSRGVKLQIDCKATAPQAEEALQALLKYLARAEDFKKAPRFARDLVDSYSPCSAPSLSPQTEKKCMQEIQRWLQVFDGSFVDPTLQVARYCGGVVKTSESLYPSASPMGENPENGGRVCQNAPESKNCTIAGKKEGVWEVKNWDGQIQSIGTYERGRRVGHWKFFWGGFAEGIVAEEGAYTEGVATGTWTSRHLNGKVGSTRSYLAIKDDKRLLQRVNDGVHTLFREDGTKEEVETYSNGTLLSSEYFQADGKILKSRHTYKQDGTKEHQYFDDTGAPVKQ